MAARLLLACPLVLLVGCAFGDRHVDLSYPAITVERAESLGNGRTVILGPFEDTREESIVGEVRNGFGMHTADVVAETPIEEWVREAIRYELESAGYRVLDGAEGVDAPTLHGQIVTVYCTAMFSYEGDVSLFATLANGPTEIFSERFSGKGSAGTNWAATGSSYADSLSAALQDALGQLMRELERAWPQP